MNDVLPLRNIKHYVKIKKDAKMANFVTNPISRRDFLKKSLLFSACFGGSFKMSDVLDQKAGARKDSISWKEAMFYERLTDKVVQCQVCFRSCTLRVGQRSFCRNKINIDGKLYSLVYSRPSAVHVDPIEKEPSLHFLPGTSILCLGSAGCNFRCKFCHNWHLSQRAIEEMERVYFLPPQEVVNIAIKEKIPTISFTYNEPTSFYEYAFDIARVAKEKGLRILWHSNGAFNPEPLKELLKYTDAVTIDLKGFTEEFYQNVSSAKLNPVLNTLKAIKQEGKWLEIVNLHIPTLNDDAENVKRMCLWIKENLGKDTPLHFTRFWPAYRLTTLPPTPIKKLEQAYNIAKEIGLEYVTIGNVPGHENNSTFCPNCGKKLIYRIHFQVLENNIKNGNCRFCGHKIPGIWS